MCQSFSHACVLNGWGYLLRHSTYISIDQQQKDTPILEWCPSQINITTGEDVSHRLILQYSSAGRIDRWTDGQQRRRDDKFWKSIQTMGK